MLGRFVSERRSQFAYVVLVRIFRYDLRVDDITKVSLPRGAQILSFAAREQRADVIEFWALVDPAQPEEVRELRVVGTGNPFDDAEHWTYLDTVITYGGALVWHIFRMASSVEWNERKGQ